jgi:hypothetical protein
VRTRHVANAGEVLEAHRYGMDLIRYSIKNSGAFPGVQCRRSIRDPPCDLLMHPVVRHSLFMVYRLRIKI